MLYPSLIGTPSVCLAMRRNMRIRNRAVIFFAFPVALILWMIGWVLYWEASHASGQICESVAKDDGVEISVGVFEKEVRCDSWPDESKETACKKGNQVVS